MTLKQHTVFTAAAAAALAPFCGAKELLAFSVGSILIDVDHYLYFVLRRKRFGIREMFRFHDELLQAKHRIPYAGLCVLHTLDFFALSAAAAVFFPVLWFFLGGLLFHFALDLVHLYRHDYLFGRAYCLAEHWIRKRRHPGYPYFT